MLFPGGYQPFFFQGRPSHALLYDRQKPRATSLAQLLREVLGERVAPSLPTPASTLLPEPPLVLGCLCSAALTRVVILTLHLALCKPWLQVGETSQNIEVLFVLLGGLYLRSFCRGHGAVQDTAQPHAARSPSREGEEDFPLLRLRSSLHCVK